MPRSIHTEQLALSADDSLVLASTNDRRAVIGIDGVLVTKIPLRREFPDLLEQLRFPRDASQSLFSSDSNALAMFS